MRTSQKRKSRQSSGSHEPPRIENVLVFGVTLQMAPLGLYSYAADFLATAKAVGPANVPLSPARSCLIAHAVELCLKAFLSLKGRPLLALANSLGRNLAALLDEAERNGLYDLVKLSDVQCAQIRNAETYYAGKIFEYPIVDEVMHGRLEWPDIDELQRAAEAMMTALREPCLRAGSANATKR